MGKELNFKYKFSDSYNPVYVNGAHGGINPQKEIVMNFFLERLPLPKEETYEVDENGVLSGPKSVSPSDHSHNLIRFVETGVICNLETAKKIHAWLGQNIANLESLTQQGEH